MSAKDISRYLNAPRRHYAGLRMQQGRVILDSDFNEEARFDDEDQRRALEDVIGPKGSPDDGFRIGLSPGDALAPSTVLVGGESVDALNFPILAGSIYLGGMRFDLDQDELVCFQRDYLQMPASEAVVSAGPIAVLTYLGAFEQCVSSTEDDEALEKALGGPDTSVRVRRMRQVHSHVIEGPDPIDCMDAFQEVVAGLENNAVFNMSTCELESQGRLRIAFDGDEAEDACAPCEPTVAGRYLGAENQAVRVMLTSADTYVWAFDNAAPLYRIKATAPSGAGHITMLTPPKDVEHWPVETTVIELLPWGAVLDNHEKVADEVGVFAVVTAYDPDTHTLEIGIADYNAFVAKVVSWDPAHPEAEALTPDERVLGYMRVWHRTSESGGEVEIPISPPQPLGRTGLVPHFEAAGRRGDYWVIAARPSEPQKVVPWDLLDAGGVAPHGPRKFYAPLGMFTWNNGQVLTVEDCRRRFRPLTEQTRCCTVTVGDGTHSHGDYGLIQDAVDALPLAGGTVCVLPGRYEQRFAIGNRHDVVIHGCGDHTVVASPDGGPFGALLSIASSQRITVRDLAFEARGETAVRIGDPGQSSGVTTLRLENLSIATQPRASVASRGAVEVHRATDVRIERCRVRMAGTLSDATAVFLQGTEIHLIGCEIFTAADQRIPQNQAVALGITQASFAWGGVQIGGGSSRIRVRDNWIVGGLGHGVTLGSLEWVAVNDPKIRIWFHPGYGYFNLNDPCPDVVPGLGGVEVIDHISYYPISAGDLEDIAITDNRIEHMATNGISVLAMLLPIHPKAILSGGGLDILTVVDLEIRHNVIRGNVQRPAEDLPFAPMGPVQAGATITEPDILVWLLVHGGIVLGEVIGGIIDDNLIADNGGTHIRPVCGIFVLLADDICVTHNHVRNNGARRTSSLAVQTGIRGGIALWGAYFLGYLANGTLDTSRVQVAGNTVDQPEGRALTLTSFGPATVTDNVFTSHGNNDPSHASSAARAVSIRNLVRGRDGVEAGILFNDNQVRLAWLEKPPSLSAWSSVGVFSGDDVVMTGNQFVAEMPGKTNLGQLNTNVNVVARDVLATSNRFKEGPDHATFSLVSVATRMNTSAHNNASHCIVASSTAGLLVNTPNLIVDASGCPGHNALLGPLWREHADIILGLRR
jgi:hypothetical protein